MKARPLVHRLIGLLAVAAGVFLLPGMGLAGDPILKGYADYDAYRRQLESIARSKLATLESLGRTLGRRDVYLLTIGTGKRDDKPAILIVGGVHPPHLAGSELAVRLAKRLVEQAARDRSVRKMLDRVTFYVIPKPSPDACEAFFHRPCVERTGNQRSTDDDGDGEFDEDAPDDLNGDGFITTLRVEDRSGPYRLHPDDDRVLIKADPKKSEFGRYSLYVEGRDNDEDETRDEDPPGGVAFNRNFTFRYPYFGEGAGPHQVSEVETRAVADFAFSHPNIGVVLSFTPEDNLMHPWKPSTSAEGERIKTALRSADAPYFNHVAEQYREMHGGEDAPESSRGEGSFSEWAYFHYGRWSFACRGWWIPKVSTETDQKDDQEDGQEDDEKDDQKGDQADKGEEEKEEPKKENEDTEAKKDDSAKDKDKKEPKEETKEAKPSAEKRGADDLNALRWFAREGVDGFVDWQPIEHPDFPGRKVELGGFKPFLRLNPPADQLDPLAEKHYEFLRRLVDMLPRVVIHETKAESLGAGVWRVTVEVRNEGYLPTMSAMGRTVRKPHPVQIQLHLSRGVSLVTGHARSQLPTLAGEGGRAERTWLVLVPRARPKSLRVRVWSPSVGSAVKRVPLTEKEEGG